MVAVDCETPMKMAISIAKDATPDSTGKEIVSLFTNEFEYARVRLVHSFLAKRNR